MRRSLLDRVLFAAFVATLFFLGVVLVRADEITCPPNVQSCKIVVVTPQEEQTLLAPNGIFDMALWASRPLGDWINGWKDKLRTAPAGKLYVSPKPAAPPSPATEKPASDPPG